MSDLSNAILLLIKQHRIRNILLAAALLRNENHPRDEKILRDIFDEEVKEHLKGKKR